MQKKPRPYTIESLERAAIRYLGRYSASEVKLRQILKRKLERAKDFDRVVDGDHQDLIDRVVTSCRNLGYVDDAHYAQALVNREHRKGRPLRVISQKLREKGVQESVATVALQTLSDSLLDPDRDAAYAYARRRRLGQFRTKEVRDDERADRARKDLGSMARAGFSYGLAKTALSVPEDDD